MQRWMHCFLQLLFRFHAIENGIRRNRADSAVAGLRLAMRRFDGISQPPQLPQHIPPSPCAAFFTPKPACCNMVRSSWVEVISSLKSISTLLLAVAMATLLTPLMVFST